MHFLDLIYQRKNDLPSAQGQPSSFPHLKLVKEATAHNSGLREDECTSEAGPPFHLSLDSCLTLFAVFFSHAYVVLYLLFSGSSEGTYNPLMNLSFEKLYL